MSQYVAQVAGYTATITEATDRCTRPFYWQLSGPHFKLGTRHGGFARTLTSAKSQCARELNYTRNIKTQLTWEKDES